MVVRQVAVRYSSIHWIFNLESSKTSLKQAGPQKQEQPDEDMFFFAYFSFIK